MKLDTLTFLTHVLSQVVNRYFHVPAGCVQDFSPQQSPSAWYEINYEDLLTYCEVLRDHFRGDGIEFRAERLREIAWLQIEETRKRGGRILVSTEQAYPHCLRATPRSPLALFTLGNVQALENPCLAIVGSRKANRRAIEQSFVAGGLLSEVGFNICSGGAFGCDIAAHEGVLSRRKTPLPAICVFASGLQSFYPKAHTSIFEDMRAHGGLFITEKLWGSPCLPAYFSARNRIVCGLSQSVLLMQAAEKSGSMISARIAADEGRDVFVLTHDADDVTAAGSQRLIDEGAVPFECAEDLIDVFCH